MSNKDTAQAIKIIKKFKSYSDFATNATDHEKEVVFTYVARKANKMQRSLIGGEQ